MITLEEILVLSLLVYGIVSLVLIGEYKNKILELENTHKK